MKERTALSGRALNDQRVVVYLGLAPRRANRFEFFYSLVDSAASAKRAVEQRQQKKKNWKRLFVPTRTKTNIPDSDCCKKNDRYKAFFLRAANVAPFFREWPLCPTARLARLALLYLEFQGCQLYQLYIQWQLILEQLILEHSFWSTHFEVLILEYSFGSTHFEALV